ncbi:hypothetical protein COOONC_07254 [Cooperia oncophora]
MPVAKKRKAGHDVEQTPTIQKIKECKVEQESGSSTVTSDMPVRNYLERNRSCPFCKRFINENVIDEHMDSCCFKEVGEENGSSSNKNPPNVKVRPRTAQHKERSRKCIRCNRWMDQKDLVDHMRDFHPVEVKKALERMNPVEVENALGKVNVVNLTTRALEVKPDFTPEPNFGDSPIPAASLLEESSLSAHCDDEEDGEDGTVSEDHSKASSVETPNHGEIVLSCSSCAKLNRRVTELESAVERLTERLIELEELMLFKKAIKEEIE